MSLIKKFGNKFLRWLLLYEKFEIETKLSKKRKYKSNVTMIIKYDAKVVDRLRSILDESAIVLSTVSLSVPSGNAFSIR